MSSGNNELDARRLLQLIGAREYELDLCREKIVTLSNALMKSEARVKELEKSSEEDS